MVLFHTQKDTSMTIGRSKIMASQKKKNKLKNSYCWGGALKNKKLKLKRVLFYTSSQRQAEKKLFKRGVDYDESNL